MSMRPIAAIVLALAPLGAQTLVIQPAKPEKTTEVRTVPFKSGSPLRVKNVTGWIHVQVWDRNEVEFRGEFKPSSRDEQVKVVIEPKADGLEIRGEFPKSGTHWGYRGPECQMDLKVPKQVLATLEGVNGDITLAGTVGQAACHAVNGDVRVRGLEGSLKADTVNGAIDLEQIKGGLELNTVNGDISGRDLDSKGMGISAETVNGAIHFKMAGLMGQLKATTVNGELSFKAAGAQEVHVKSNKVTALFPGSDQSLTIHTVNGAITLE